MLAASGWLLLVFACPADATGEPIVTVMRQGHGLYKIQAHALVRASHQTLWDTLTDYEKFAQFVPGLHASHVMSRSGMRCMVRQQWRVSLLLFSYPIDLTVLSVERPPSALEVHLVSGNLKRLDGGYSIEEGPDGRYSVLWDGFVEDSTLFRIGFPPLSSEN